MNSLMYRIGVAAALLAAVVIGPRAHASFSGAYDPTNWTLSFTGSPTNLGGEVDTSLVPTSITLTGANSGVSGYTLYETTSQTNGIWSFHWSYGTADPSLTDDLGGYFLNGTYDFLANGMTATPSGDVTIAVNNGDTIGYWVRSISGANGAGRLTVSNLIVIPEPSTALLVALGLLGVFAQRRQQS